MRTLVAAAEPPDPQPPTTWVAFEPATVNTAAHATWIRWQAINTTTQREDPRP